MPDDVIFFRRNFLLIAICAVVVTAIAAVFAATASTTFEATAKVFFSNYSIGASIVTPDVATINGVQTAQAQAQLAQTPLVVRATLQQAGRASTESAVQRFISHNNVASGQGVVTFVVRSAKSIDAIELATAWARASLTERRRLDSQPIDHALSDIKARLADLRASGNTETQTYVSLVDKQAQLETAKDVQFANGVLVQPALRAVRIGTSKAKTLVFAFIGGVALGIALALLREAIGGETRPPRLTRRDWLPEDEPLADAIET